MKRQLFTGMTALLLVVYYCVGAFAFKLTEELFTLDIPEGNNVYYYTTHGTNMTGTMLENAQRQDVQLLIGEYNDEGTLQYTLKVEEKEGTAEELANTLPQDLSGQYDIQDTQMGDISGQTGYVLSGGSLNNPSYGVKLWIFGDSPAVVLTSMYKTEAESMVEEIISTITWPQRAVASPQPTPNPTPTPTVAVEETPVPTVAQENTKTPGTLATLTPVEETETVTPSAETVASSRSDRWPIRKISVWSYGVPQWVQWVFAAGMAVITLILVRCIDRCIKRRRYWPRHIRFVVMRWRYWPRHVRW